MKVYALFRRVQPSLQTSPMVVSSDVLRAQGSSDVRSRGPRNQRHSTTSLDGRWHKRPQNTPTLSRKKEFVYGISSRSHPTASEARL